MNIYRFENIEIDLAALTLRVAGLPRSLEPKYFRLLCFLLENRARVVPKEEIFSSIWTGVTVSENALTRAIAQIRKALDDDPRQPRYIATVPTVGYRFIAALLPEALPEAPASHAQTLIAAEAARVPARPSAGFNPLRSGAVVFVLVLIAGGVLWSRRETRLPSASYPVPLTTLPGPSNDAEFSPDGSQITYTWVGPPGKEGQRHSHIYRKPVGNGDPVQLTFADATDELPRWSPDGARIAFIRNTPTGADLILIPSRGGPEQRITATGKGVAWSPDGMEIAYVRPYSGSGGIEVRSLTTGAVRVIAPSLHTPEYVVAWSPDGRQIAFGRNVTDSACELFVVPAAGGEARQITFDRQLIEGFAWTGDSRELIFSSARLGGTGLWRISATGGTPEAINARAHHPIFPALSIQTHRLAFTEEYSDSNIWEFRRDAAGGDAPFQTRKCLICSTAEDDTPRFSPDGKRIVFVSKRTGSEEIWVADEDGGHPAQLTSIGGSPTGSPRWSPDGRWIVFDSRFGGNADIFVVSAKGGSLRQVTTWATKETMPSWSHDGGWIYFTSNRGGEYRIWKVSAAGGEPGNVTSGPGSEPVEDPDGRYLYYYNGDSIWRVLPDGAGEEPVPELRGIGRTRAWAVGRDGIYFYRDGPDSSRSIQFFSFASHKMTAIYRPELGPVRNSPGLDVSPDGGKLLYTQTDHTIEGLQMIANFR